MAEAKDNASVVTWAREFAQSRAQSFFRNDGTVSASFRQGIDELGMALKAFPESIQAYEMGALWSPTPYEVSMARTAHGDTTSPADVAKTDVALTPDAGEKMHVGKSM